MNAVDYAIVLARIAKAASRMNDLIRSMYGENPTIEVGYKQDMQDWQNKAPFLVFAPNTTEENAEESVESHVWMWAALLDEDVVDNDGIAVLRAYGVLNELLDIARNEFPRELRAVVPTAFMKEMNIEFRQENYPLMWAVADIVITENVPVGGRPARR